MYLFIDRNKTCIQENSLRKTQTEVNMRVAGWGLVDIGWLGLVGGWLRVAGWGLDDSGWLGAG